RARGSARRGSAGRLREAGEGGSEPEVRAGHDARTSAGGARRVPAGCGPDVAAVPADGQEGAGGAAWDRGRAGAEEQE
ncbi:hypothetical protein LTR53_020605, partial [Teratosphaeriaceae sp. CCFEE 6253]